MKQISGQKNNIRNDKEFHSVSALLVKAQSGEVVNVNEAVDAIKTLYMVTIEQVKSHNHQYALYSLNMGSLMNELKKQVKKQKIGKWIPWSSTNLSFIQVRTRQYWMRIAEEDDAVQFAHLGISALGIILTGIDNLYPKEKHQKRISDFFKESTYPFQEYRKTEEVKKLAGIHVFEVKAKREGLDFDTELINAIGEYDASLTDKLIEEMLQHQHTGGTDAVNNLLKLYIVGKGKNPKLSTSTKTKSRQLSIDRSLQNFDNALKYYEENFDSLGDIRLEDIEKIQIDLKERISNIYWLKLVHDVMQ